MNPTVINKKDKECLTNVNYQYNRSRDFEFSTTEIIGRRNYLDLYMLQIDIKMIQSTTMRIGTSHNFNSSI